MCYNGVSTKAGIRFRQLYFIIKGRKIMALTKKIMKKLKSGTWYPFYNTFYEKLSIDKSEILLASRSGISLESNILAILKELQKPEYSRFKKILAVHKNSRQIICRKLERYHISVDKIVQMSTPEYYFHLAKAGYLINDTTFPGRYIKKDGQIYLNVWHGTPLKRMGQDNADERYDMGNIMRNLLMSDYLVFPNLYMEEKMAGAFNLTELYQGRILHEGYPRNCIFFDQEHGRLLKDQLGYQGCQLSIYMPTFRGRTDNVEGDPYVEQVKEYLRIIDSRMDDNQILLVKLHPLVQKQLGQITYRHIRPFPQDLDTYDVLNACDVLITDYSSVLYDFANTGRKIILFAYDKEDYLGHRGMYEDISTYPFPVVTTAEEVADELKTRTGGPDKAFLDKYCTFERISATSNICRHVLLGEKICQEAKMPGTDKKKVLLYAGSLKPNGITTAYFSLLRNLDREKCSYYVSYRSPSLKEAPERIQGIPEGYHYYPLATEMNLDVLTGIAQLCYLKWGITSFGIKKRLQKAYQREWKKHFGNAPFDQVVHFDGYENYMIALFEQAPCIRTIWVHNDMEKEIAAKKNPSRPLLAHAYRTYDHVVPVGEDIRPAVERIGGHPSNIQVISNYMDVEDIRSRAARPLSFDPETQSTVPLETLKKVLDSSDTKFINIGRYSPEKGHERLIRTFDIFRKDHPDTWLIIIGGMGTLYESTCQLAKSLPCGDHVILLKSMTNPMPVLASCDFFILSSFYEGQVLVVPEADVLGIPAAACDVNGARSFLKQYGGTLLPDSEEGILQGMEMFMDGKIHPMNVDYDKRNQEILNLCETLFLK